VHLPGLSGLDLQQELAKAGVKIPIIFITGHGDIPTSVRAMKAGALEFLTKPLNREDLLRAIQQAIARDNIARQPNRDTGTRNFDEIIGESPALKRTLKQVEIVAPTDSAVLLLGETGTGKELIARAIHNLSFRRERTLVKVNCAAIPTGLLESELFGHEKGAFTGAIAQRIGRFELADGGTVFLDEVGEIPLELQPKLLRVLQEREFERLGSTRTLRTDARLIAATNRDLRQMVEQQKFREDLFYRLNVFPIFVPALRERSEDIPLLVNHFAQRFARRMNRTIETIPVDVRLIAATNRDLKEAIKQGRFREDLYYRLAVVTIRLPTLMERGDDLVLLTAYYVRLFAERYRKKIHAISDRALELLRAHAWVGNVRELRNVIERAVIVATDETLRAEHLPDELRGEETTLADRPQGGLLTLAEAEARHIARVLAHTNGQIGAAAEILGIHRNTLTRKMKEYGL